MHEVQFDREMQEEHPVGHDIQYLVDKSAYVPTLHAAVHSLFPLALKFIGRIYKLQMRLQA